MVTGTLAFLAGILLFHQSAVLPPWWAAGAAVPLLALAWRLRRVGRRPALVVAAVTAGYLWTWGCAAPLLQSGVPPGLEGRDLWLEGVVSALPEAEAERVRFQFDSVALQRNGTALTPPGRVLLSWYGTAPALRVGQRWRLQVRLRRPHGMANPGGFDYERWLFQRGIRATGYVRPHRAVLLQPQAGQFPLQQLRQWLRGRLRSDLGQRPMAGIVTALALGDRQGIGRDQWRVFSATGTTHLIAISGLHIGIVAGLVLFLVRWGWGWSQRLTLWLPAPKAAAAAALMAATGYAALAGFSVPTQRALIMLAVALAALWWQRPLRPARTLALALLLVLLADPLAPLAPGFWLSYGAVALIVYGMGGRLAPAGWWWRWGRTQWLVALGLAPLLALWFQQVPLIAPVANLVAVPWVTLFTVPLTLLGTVASVVLPVAAPPLLAAACHTLEILWWFLAHLAGLLPQRWGAFAPPLWTLLPALVGLAWMLAPRGWPSRWLGVLWLLPALLARPPGPAPGEMWLTLLDVGQGLAAVVRTAGHTLVFDTGPRYSDQLDAGNAVIVPFLRSRGIREVDTLLVSHGDMDHIGGAASLLASMPVGHIITGVQRWRLPHPAQPCHAGMAWHWDGVRFELLYPPPGGDGSGDNDRSCVLKVSTAGGSVLLPGDIERPTEEELMRTVPERLRSTVLVAPHHGSNTSSTLPFVTAVAPRYVLFAVGYRNRYGFPSRRVAARYRAVGAQGLDTASGGATTLRFDDGPPTVERYRQSSHHYWYAE